MKRLLIAASAALLAVAPALALAQEDHHDGGGRPEGRPPEGRPQGAPPAPSRPAGPPAGGGAPAYHPPSGPQGGGAPAYRPQGQGGQGGPNVPGGPGGQGYRPNVAQPGYRPGQAPGAPGGQPGRGFAPQGDYRGGQPPRTYAQGVRPRPGALAFNYGGRQYYRYHAAPYAYPRGYYGWSNHAWRIGEWLPAVFISEGYYINDWYDFGLYQPYYGYQWVRVGGDAVLVDLATGAVVDVVPGVYYW